MEQNKFLYTDGRDVVVTQSTFQTKKALYRLKGITDFGLEILRPKRILGVVLFLIGAIIAANGVLHFIPFSFFDALSIPIEYATSNILIPIGLVIASIGITCIILVRRRYAVRIETAEGRKNAVVSRSRAYVDQIVSAIRKAKSSAFARR